MPILYALVAAVNMFSGASALEFTRKITAFGPRPPGSPAIQKARDFIRTQLTSTGAELVEDRFTAVTPGGPVAMENIIARFPGASGSALVITGHYDTKLFPGRNFVGANDGGSSAGFLLEMARALTKAPRKHDIYLVWFDGEEAFVEWAQNDSLYGSRHLADRWAREGKLARIRALVNVDMIGDKNLDVLNEWNSSAPLRRLIWQIAAELGYSRFFQDTPSATEDDHIPFLRRGVQAVDLIDFNYGPANAFWHTDQDTMDKLGPQSFEIIGRVLLELIHRLEM